LGADDVEDNDCWELLLLTTLSVDAAGKDSDVSCATSVRRSCCIVSTVFAFSTVLSRELVCGVVGDFDLDDNVPERRDDDANA